MNRSLTEAILKGDAKDFDRLTSDDYVLTSSTGKLWDKQKDLEALKEGTLRFEKIDDSDVKVHLYGDAAVVTGKAEIKANRKTGRLTMSIADPRVRPPRRPLEMRDGAPVRVWTPEEREKDKEPTKDKDK